ncbi:MAG TPA: hypothetical protein VOA87_05840 [Thermoanaerobaculia bacterium]|nr:hypothetical protein [Thermoanaerobaculia bacterium]
MGIVIGIDIGQKRDPTAICVAQADDDLELVGKTGVHFAVRYLQRLPLRTPYPEVAKQLVRLIGAVRERAPETTPTVFVDATGVGQPVVDLLREGVRGAWVHAVYFTHGDRRSKENDGSVSLGKAWLVSRLQALLQAGRLHLPKIPEAEALAQELLDYEIRVSEDANDRYGAFRVGTHDDLVTALGLAVQVNPPRVWLR